MLVGDQPIAREHSCYSFLHLGNEAIIAISSKECTTSKNDRRQQMSLAGEGAQKDNPEELVRE